MPIPLLFRSFLQVCTVAWISALFALRLASPALETQAFAQTGAVPSVSPIARDADSIEVVIPAVNGKIDWRDVGAAIAEAMTLDAPTVQAMLPPGQLDVQSDAVMLVLLGINLAGGDAIDMDLVEVPNLQPGQPGRSVALRVRCKRSLFGPAKSSAGSKHSATQHHVQTVSVDLDPDWAAQTKTRPLVICLHGLQSDATVFETFREHLAQRGFASAAVTYDYNLSIAESAALVCSAVNAAIQSTSQPDIEKPSLAIIGHSMGGLVGREWTENPALENRSIKALITLGSPHSGSNWASLPPLADLFTGKTFDGEDLMDVILHQPSSQGMRDLVPDSTFLNQLNARPRRSDVAYTAIVGTNSPVEASELVNLQETLRSLDRQGSLLRLIRPRIKPLLESFDEMTTGKGDGMVACERAKIPNCDDTVLLPVSHFNMLQPLDDTSNQAGSGSETHRLVWDTVAQRLQRIRN